MPRLLSTWTLLAATAAASGAQPAPALFTPLPGTVPPEVGTAVGQRIAVDVALLDAEPAQLRFDLPEGRVLIAERSGVERRGPGDLAWRGRLVDGGVTLTLRHGFVVGRLHAGVESWEVRTLADGGQAVDRLDPRRFPSCATPPVEASTTGGDPDPCPNPSDPVDGVDLLSLYTPQARDAAGGVPQIEALIQGAVDITNTAFIDSQMPIRFALAGTALADRDDSGDIGADLTWLRNDVATAMLRDELQADMVSLIVANGGGFCGIGQLPIVWNAGGHPDLVHQVTADGCAVGNLTFAHEHGHNMGLEHDPANGNPPDNGTFTFRFGHFVDGEYRTVMSYSNQCSAGCPRVPHWSNPDVVFMGDPTGIPDQRDNRRASAGTDGCVTDYRLRGLFADGFESGDTSRWSSEVP